MLLGTRFLRLAPHIKKPVFQQLRNSPMTLKRFFGLALALILAGSSVSVRTAGTVASKELWLSDMRNLLPAMFCRNGSYFRECFEADATVCHSTATGATESCLLQFEPQIPKQLQQPNDGAFWGNKIGICAGTIFEITLQKSRVDSAKCNDPTFWK